MTFGPLSEQAVIGCAELARSVPSAIQDLSVHCAVLGLRLSIQLFPEGSAVRDAGQLRLNARLRWHVHASFEWRTEVTIEGGASPRAWDILLGGPGTIGIDSETRLHDLQALQRRCEGKLRDSAVERTALLVARTRHNTEVLRAHRDALRSTFPADSAEVLRALRSGRLPPRNRLVIL